MSSPLYAKWLKVADELTALHVFAYGPQGLFKNLRNAGDKADWAGGC